MFSKPYYRFQSIFQTRRPRSISSCVRPTPIPRLPVYAAQPDYFPLRPRIRNRPDYSNIQAKQNFDAKLRPFSGISRQRRALRRHHSKAEVRKVPREKHGHLSQLDEVILRELGDSEISDADKILQKQMAALNIDRALRTQLLASRGTVARAEEETASRVQKHAERDAAVKQLIENELAEARQKEFQKEQARLEEQRKKEQFEREQKERVERQREETRKRQARLEEERRVARLEAEQRQERERQERARAARLEQAQRQERLRQEREWAARLEAEQQERERQHRARAARWQEEQRQAREHAARLEAAERLAREHAARVERERLRAALDRLCPTKPTSIFQQISQYDEMWILLRAGLRSEPIGFDQIPWPVLGTQVARPEDITYERVQEFVFHTLRNAVEGKSRREKVRVELLKWHPDKFNNTILAKVGEKERRLVGDAGAIVVRILMQMLSEETEKENRGM